MRTRRPCLRRHFLNLQTGSTANLSAGATLTIDPTAVISAGSVTLGDKLLPGAANAIINQGRLTCDYANQVTWITSDTFTNSGVIGAS